MLEYIRIELNKNRIDYKVYLSKNETKYDERLEDFKKFWKSASKALNIKECSCSCRGFLKKCHLPA